MIPRRLHALASALLSGAAAAPLPALAIDLSTIETIVVIYAENHSFDNIYGLFPGANGIANATPEQTTQLDHDGTMLPYLQVWDADGKPIRSFPTAAERAVPHRPAAGRAERRPGRCPARSTRTITTSSRSMAAERHVRRRCRTVGGWTMGYYDGSDMKLWQWAKELHARRQFLHGRLRRLVPQPPVADLRLHAGVQGRARSMRAQLDERRQAAQEKAEFAARRREGAVHMRTGGGPGHARRLLPSTRRSRRTSRAACRPRPAARSSSRIRRATSVWPAAAAADREDDRRHALGQGRTLGMVCRRLERRSRRRHAAARGKAPVIYSEPTARVEFPAAPPALQLLRALRAGHRGSRAAPQGRRGSSARHRDGHAAAGDVLQAGRHARPSTRPTPTCMSGDAHIAELLEKLTKSPQWERMLVIVTYDENGGFWDHVAAALGRRLGRSLGPGDAHSGAHRLAVRQARLRRPHGLRHDVDLEADHQALRSRAAAGRAREDGRPDRRARLAVTSGIDFTVQSGIAGDAARKAGNGNRRSDRRSFSVGGDLYSRLRPTVGPKGWHDHRYKRCRHPT